MTIEEAIVLGRRCGRRLLKLHSANAKERKKKMRLFYIGLLGAFLAAAPLDAAELNWLPLTGTERAPASSGEQVLQGPFTSWWFGDFASVAIWFSSNPAGLYFYVK